MKKSTKNLIGLALAGLFYVLVLMPILMSEPIRLPSDGNMLGVTLLWVLAFPTLSFLIPGMIALIEYTKNRTFWRYFYHTGWVIYIFLLVLFSVALGNHSMN